MKEIKYKDRTIFCDDEDYNTLKDLPIYLQNNGVVYTMLNNKAISIARYLLKLPKSFPLISYKDGNKSNLQKDNLLAVTHISYTYEVIDNIYHVRLKTGEAVLCDSLEVFKNCTPCIYKKFVRIKTYPDDRNHTVAREILGLDENDKNVVVLYKDNNTLNLCKNNLYTIKKATSIRNNIKKELKGVYKYGTKWKVILSIDNKSKYFGSFDSKEEANTKRDLILKEIA